MEEVEVGLISHFFDVAHWQHSMFSSLDRTTNKQLGMFIDATEVKKTFLSHNGQHCKFSNIMGTTGALL